MPVFSFPNANRLSSSIGIGNRATYSLLIFRVRGFSYSFFFISHLLIRTNRPTVMSKGDGCRLYDVDGNDYLDFSNNRTSMILGNNHPKIVEAITPWAPLVDAMMSWPYIRPSRNTRLTMQELSLPLPSLCGRWNRLSKRDDVRGHQKNKCIGRFTKRRIERRSYKMQDDLMKMWISGESLYHQWPKKVLK